MDNNTVQVVAKVASVNPPLFSERRNVWSIFMVLQELMPNSVRNTIAICFKRGEKAELENIVKAGQFIRATGKLRNDRALIISKIEWLTPSEATLLIQQKEVTCG